MKLINRIKHTILNIRESTKRFPVTIIVSIILAALLIYFNEVTQNITADKRSDLIRLNMIAGLGIPLFLCIELLKERFFSNKKYSPLITYLLGGLFLFIYYNLLLEGFGMVEITRYIATILLFIIVFFYIQRIDKDKYYENYVIKIFSSIALTIIYSAVLYFGLSAILFTIDNLFEININYKYYLYIFIIVVFVFGVSLFLSKLPDVDSKYTDYPMSLRILLIYIVIPLLTVYNLILYAYFLKIIVTWVWPKGLVSHLVLWSSAISVGVIFLITPVLEENRVAKLFKIWFPKAVLPILVMMFMSIGIRVNQYGITENRYYIILFGLWITGIMLYYSFKKPLRNIIIPISLSIVVLIAAYGPLSSYSLSKRSQNNRLINILEENDMLRDGNIVSNFDIPEKDKREISNIINYFNSNHSIEDIAVLPDDFQISEMQELMGFDYLPYIPYGLDVEYFYFNLNERNQVLDIRDFDYYVNISSWNFTSYAIDDLVIQYDNSNHSLSISRNNSIIINQDLKTFVQDIYDKNQGKDNRKNIIEPKEMTYISENENIRLKFIFISINGRKDIINGDVSVEEIDFLLMVDVK